MRCSVCKSVNRVVSRNLILFRLNIGGAKNLSRKRAFKVVPYSASTDVASTELTPKGGKAGFDRNFPVLQPTVARSDSDRQLLLLPLATRDENRRKRREAAMNHSKLAHQYRAAKSAGDEKAMHSSKSLLNLLGKTKSRRMSRAIKTTEAPADDDDDQSGPGVRAQEMEDFLADNAETVSEKNNDSTNNMSPQGSSHNLNSGSTSSHSLHKGLNKLKPRPRPQEESSDSDTGDIVSDSDFDDHDDEDDDDYGTNETIQQLDDEGLDAVFDAIADCGKQTKVTDENTDLVEWNHVMVSKGVNPSLVAPAAMTNTDLEIKVAMSESIVSRSYMEDRSYANVNEPGSRSKGCSPLAICAVFDGHNGTYASQMLQDRFSATFTSLFRAAELRPDFRDGNYSNHVVGIFEEASALLDVELLRADYIRQQNTIKTGIQDVQSFAGSVAVMMAVTPVAPMDMHMSMKASPRANKLDEDVGKVQAFVAHVGDCRAVLCNDGVAVALTVDHKPSLKSEKARIEAAGGWVHSGRVNGSLGVSRSFGDIQFKVFTETPGQVNGVDNLQASIWSANQQVISKPEVKHFIVEKPFEFVILACDGLWDVFDDQEAVNFVRKRLSVTRNVEKTAQELVQKAIKRGTQDNTSVVIVVFHQTEITLM
jgi:serine/threonine protein phosphatase PrpC